MTTITTSEIKDTLVKHYCGEHGTPNDDGEIIDDLVMTDDELADHLRMRLHSGWVMICGDYKTVSKVTAHAYPIGTKDIYEMVGFPVVISIGKKTERMRSLLGNPDCFDEMIGVNVKADSETRADTSYFVPLPGEMESAIDDMVEQAREFWGDRKV